MEMLYYVPSEQGFDKAERIMEAPFTLRPVLVQELLHDDSSLRKGTKPYYGYKAHIAVYTKDGFILGGHMTPAHAADSRDSLRPSH
jgi:hypothetical protein